MALGHADPEHASASMTRERAEVDEIAEFRGF
jgi:hypothetical protein